MSTANLSTMTDPDAFENNDASSEKASSPSVDVQTEQTTHENDDSHGNLGPNIVEGADNTSPPSKRKKNRWGGKFIRAMKETKGNFSEYSDNFAIEGLDHTFDSSNSKARTTFWFTMFIAFGAFFFYTTIPLIQDYNDKAVVTSLDTETGTNGLPLPIVTICPHGSGVRCNCELWRKLHCRYRYWLERYDWMSRFDEWSCWTNFDLEHYIEGKHPTWIDLKCDDFNFTRDDKDGTEDPFLTVLDPCNIDEDIEAEPSFQIMTASKIYQRIVQREKSPKGPYITLEEAIFYSGHRFDRNIFFIDRYRQPVNPNWVNYRHFDWSFQRLCTQLRPPNNDPAAKQYAPGNENGFTVVVQGISENNYPLKDMLVATPTVDIHININQDGPKYFDDLIVVPRNEYFTAASKLGSSVEYASSIFKRYPGWGSDESRSCKHAEFPRNVCALSYLLRSAADECGCDPPQIKEGRTRTNPPFMGCSVTEETDEYQCLLRQLDHERLIEVSLEECPHACVTRQPIITKNNVLEITRPQLLGLRRQLSDEVSLNIAETAFLQVGLSSMDIEVVAENPLVSFGELMGQIGGNLGLWCGLSFLTIVETFEFIIIALLYSRGVYSGNGKTIGERLRSTPTRRGKRSAHV